MLIFLSMSILLSISVAIYSHPITILISILAQTVTICLILWIYTKSSWFSFILFLIFLGGLMVLFIYIASLASNEVFKINNTDNMTIIMMSTILVTFFFLNKYFLGLPPNSSFSTENKILMIFSDNLFLPLILIMSYLLLVLIVAVKVSSKIEGPMRNFI
nr:NADH dehydrogenase subunit 6 [Homidia koreana]